MDVAQFWFNQWKEARLVDIGPLEWETFQSNFFDRFFPFEMREPKMVEFVNLGQGNRKEKSKPSTMKPSKTIQRPEPKCLGKSEENGVSIPPVLSMRSYAHIRANYAKNQTLS